MRKQIHTILPQDSIFPGTQEEEISPTNPTEAPPIRTGAACQSRPSRCAHHVPKRLCDIRRPVALCGVRLNAHIPYAVIISLVTHIYGFSGHPCQGDLLHLPFQVVQPFLCGKRTRNRHPCNCLGFLVILQLPSLAPARAFRGIFRRGADYLHRKYIIRRGRAVRRSRNHAPVFQNQDFCHIKSP